MPLELIPPDEQLVRKKAEEKPSVPRMRKGHIRIPEITGVPIIPEDPCCAKICETLNDDIEKNRDTLNAIVYIGGEKIHRNAIYRSLVYQIEALEEHRKDLKDKNICGCITDTDTISAKAPIQDKTKESIITKGVSFIIPSPKRIKRTHFGEKSIVPPTNSCCPESCKILNKDIDLATKIIDKMELRGGLGATDNPRYEAWYSKATALQDYRIELKNKGSCKCVE